MSADAEAAALASLVARRTSGRVDGARRRRTAAPPGTWRDVAVLIPSRTELHIYEEALARAGVPYRHEGGRTFFMRQEVRELIAVLRAIDDPCRRRGRGRGAAVVGVRLLRRGAAAAQRRRLLRLPKRARRRGRAGARTRCVSSASSRGAAARAARCRTSCGTVLDRTRLVEFAMLQPQGEQVAANLLKIIDQARAFADASGGGLRGFVRWLKREHRAATYGRDRRSDQRGDRRRRPHPHGPRVEGARVPDRRLRQHGHGSGATDARHRRADAHAGGCTCGSAKEDAVPDARLRGCGAAPSSVREARRACGCCTSRRRARRTGSSCRCSRRRRMAGRPSHR